MAERAHGRTRLALVVRGGNATVADLVGWADRFGLR
jgi:hypothetical protein